MIFVVGTKSLNTIQINVYLLHENLTVPQLVTNFPEFCGTRRFITALSSAPHLSVILSQNNTLRAFLFHFLKTHCNTYIHTYRVQTSIKFNVILILGNR